MKDDTVILLVEDDQKDVALTLRALRKTNVVKPIVVARDGVAALDYVFSRGAYADRDPMAVPQLVLLDLKLPKLDGHDVLKALRESELARFVPVVVLTSSLEEQDLIRSYSLGVNGYVRKPVDFVQFMEAVRQLALFWLVLNQTAPLMGRT